MYFLNIINKEFLFSINKKPNFEKVLILSWVFMPILMFLSKSIVDIFIVLIVVSFLIKSITSFSWDWLKITWIKWAFLFLFMILVSSQLSFFPKLSLLNGASWIRFPIFALAISIWLIKEKEILHMGLLLSFLSLIIIFFLMGLESLLTDKHIFTWPFRNPLNGPFIHRIGLIFYSISFIILFSNQRFKFTASLFIVISIFFSLLSGHRVGTFNFFIIILIMTFWPKLNLIKSMYVSLFSLTILCIFFLLNPMSFERYFLDVVNLSNTSLQQYLGLWKTGINTFLDYFIIGVGPTNMQNYLEAGIIENYDPFYNNEHPHNHYLQAFVETGIIGGSLYCTMLVYIFKEIYIKTKKIEYDLRNILIYASTISFICLFWPFSNTHDLFGQQQNAFLWYSVSLCLVICKTYKNSKI